MKLELTPLERTGLEFDGAQLPSGTYLVELRTSRERRAEKLVIVR
jgi:hypothetical protein